jgi:peptidoglycan lytic transglycosylase
VRPLNGLILLGCALLLSGCSAARWNGDAPDKVTATTEELPRSKSGNPPFYKVFGVRYSVMNSSMGYKERGVASWYGKKFHGRKTSSGERYDMYQMTAAHKSLPLPTIVRVTNLNNGRSIVVRVNDRGPFVKNRIIDLSYSAAIELDMTREGTALVEVEALTAAKTQTVKPPPVVEPAVDPAGSIYVQVGAFGEQGNAKKLAQKLNNGGISKVAVHKQNGQLPMIYRVRIGPLSSVIEYDRIVRQVEGLAILETQLIIEPPPASGS